MEIFFWTLVLIGACIYAYYVYQKEQEKKKREEADKSLLKDKDQELIATMGSYDGFAIVRDTDENRLVGFLFYDRLKQVKIISAKLNKIFDLPYDEIIDCKAYTETIVGESTTTAETATDYSRSFYDPNATTTKFVTTKDPDKKFYYISITTSSMSAPLVTFMGDSENIYKLEALIKIVIKKRQS